MNFDVLTLAAVRREIKDRAVGGRIQRVSVGGGAGDRRDAHSEALRGKAAVIHRSAEIPARWAEVAGDVPDGQVGRGGALCVRAREPFRG